MKAIALSALLFIPVALSADGYPGRFTLHPEKFKRESTAVYAYYVSFPWDHALAEVYVIEYRSTEIVRGRRIEIVCSRNPPSKSERYCPRQRELTTDLSAKTARAVVACFKELDLSAPSDSAKQGQNVLIADGIGIDVAIIDESGTHEASFTVGDSRQIRSFNKAIEELKRNPL